MVPLAPRGSTTCGPTTTHFWFPFGDIADGLTEVKQTNAEVL